MKPQILVLGDFSTVCFQESFIRSGSNCCSTAQENSEMTDKSTRTRLTRIRLRCDDTFRSYEMQEARL